jgi:hypothetical protein
MRTFAGLICLSATLFAAPAFADPQAMPLDSRATSGSLTDANRPATANLNTPAQSTVGNSWIDRLSVTRSADRPVLPLAPIETDQLALSVRPGSNWGITLGLTTRQPNDLLPQEEFKAGAYFQISPNFRFGGGVTLNGDSLRSAAEGWQTSRSAKDAEAGVRIESAFSF